MIKNVDLFWMKIPFDGAIGYYPQEIEIQTETGYTLISFIEVNQGKVNTEFTNELLIIDNKNAAKLLKLGRYGVRDNGREYFNTYEEVIQATRKNWC